MMQSLPQELALSNGTEVRFQHRCRRAACLAAALAIAGAVAVSAHDLWIEPSGFTPGTGTRVAVRLRIGQLFQGDPFPRDPKLMLRFAILALSAGSGSARAALPASGASGAGREEPILGVPDTDPAGFLVAGPPGLYALIYTSNHAAVELDAAKFEKYLADEGLEKIGALRARRGQTGSPAREIYSRCAKSLIAVGGDPGSGHDRVLGLPLELVPEMDPYTLAAGQELAVRLLYHGSPLAGAKVAALAKDQPSRQVAARTDAQGRVRLVLDRPGVWLVKAVHMIPAPPGAGADWESFWASLTFALPARAAR
jgi:uncharacterized GH25 family protein